MMLTVPADRPGQVNRVDFDEELFKVREVASSIKRSDADTLTKAEREMSICEMQLEFSKSTIDLRRAQADHERLSWKAKPVGPEPKPVVSREPAGGIGSLYCRLTAELSKRIHPKPLQAAEAPRQD